VCKLKLERVSKGLNFVVEDFFSSKAVNVAEKFSVSLLSKIPLILLINGSFI
jgi:hypothetical protein